MYRVFFFDEELSGDPRFTRRVTFDLRAPVEERQVVSAAGSVTIERTFCKLFPT